MMFSNRQLRALLVPLIIEQVLTSLMGIVDTMMVANVGSAAVSGVSCVDTINKLVLYMLTALATGGAIVCSQYLGRRDRDNAGRAARQVLLGSFAMGAAIMLVCLLLRRPILGLVFGQVERSVMQAAEDYFLVTAFSYPFLALFNAGAAIYRSSGNSRLPMAVSVCCNFINIGGNALLMFVFHMGVTGAALATTVSTVLSALVLLALQRRKGQEIDLGRLRDLRPDWKVIGLVLSIGIPSGLENSMFQLGKLVVQSTVSTLGTTAISANAIVVVLELMNCMPSMAIGIGLVTVAGQCIGAGKPDQARYYIRKLTIWSAAVLLVTVWLIYFATAPVMALAGLEPEAAEMGLHTMLWISIVKPFLWPLAFTPVNGMRAAGDVRFALIVSAVSMWVCRVGLTTVLCRFLGVGLLGVWSGYFVDWAVRSVAFTLRFRSGKWTRRRVIQ